MAISARAQANHGELFPNHVSTLKITDPELIEVFDNFAFDDVLRHGTADTRTRLMVQLAAMIASAALGEYRVMLGAALTVGVTPVEVKEIVYQAVPYVGMARVFDLIHATNEVLTYRGVELPVESQSTIYPRDARTGRTCRSKTDRWRRRGRWDVCSRGRRRGPLPAFPVCELLRRLPDTHGCRRENP
jgi:4-carboxymuconolactone decarboxylase